MEELVKETFLNKRVFITGHTGFKGSWLTKMLLTLGAQVKGYALQAASESNFNLLHLSKDIIHVEADIRDREKLSKELNDFKPDYLFHLAAQPLVLESYREPIYTFEVNYMGTVHVLDALKSLEHACTAVFVTTDKVYQDQNWDYPYRESDNLGGFDPYSASKASSELAISAYRNSFFNSESFPEHQKIIVSARAGNVIGGGDFSANRLLPDILKTIGRNEKLIIRNPDAIRPWQHVLDACFAYLALAAKLTVIDQAELPNTYNFAPENNDFLTVNDLVQKCIALWGKGEYEVVENMRKQKETKVLKLDISRAKATLGWTPKWSTEVAIAKTIEWQKSYLENSSATVSLSQKQIEEFLS